MLVRATAVLAATALVCLIPGTGQALTPYGQSFETLVQTEPGALGADGWLVYGNVFDTDGTYLYGYGPYPAPNHNLAFSQIVSGEGGPSQEVQQLVVFSDYENGAHADTSLVESNVYQEQRILLADLGTAWTFEFDAKLGNIAGSSTGAAFIKMLDPSAGYALTKFLTVDMTSIPTTWNRYRLDVWIEHEDQVDQILQFGFMNTATLYESSGIFYDNVTFEQNPVDVPFGREIARATLGQNHPNPFNPRTRIDFALERPGTVEIAVFDLAGRRIARLHRGDLEAGDHHVYWDGRTEGGHAAPAGQYLYVLKTATGQLSRRMLLLK